MACHLLHRPHISSPPSWTAEAKVVLDHGNEINNGLIPVYPPFTSQAHGAKLRRRVRLVRAANELLHVVSYNFNYTFNLVRAIFETYTI